MDKFQFENSYRKKVNHFFATLHLQNDSALKDFFSIIKENNIPVYAFGGFPRELYFNSGKINPRDIDLVSNLSKDEYDKIKNLFSNYLIGINKFGGLKIKYRTLEVDVWTLNSTWAYQNKILSSISFYKMIESTFLNFDAILFEVNPRNVENRNIYLDGFYETVEKGIIDVNLPDNPYMELNIIRAIHFAIKYNYKLGLNLCELIIHNIDKLDFQNLSNIVKAKYERNWPEKVLKNYFYDIFYKYNFEQKPVSLSSIGDLDKL